MEPTNNVEYDFLSYSSDKEIRTLIRDGNYLCFIYCPRDFIAV